MEPAIEFTFNIVVALTCTVVVAADRVLLFFFSWQKEKQKVKTIDKRLK